MSTPLTPEQEMLQRYRNIFASNEGKLVLGDILIKGHYGVTLDPDNAAMVSEYNFAVVIATLAGAFDSLYTQLGMVTKER